MKYTGNIKLHPRLEQPPFLKGVGWERINDWRYSDIKFDTPLKITLEWAIVEPVIGHLFDPPLLSNFKESFEGVMADYTEWEKLCLLQWKIRNPETVR